MIEEYVKMEVHSTVLHVVFRDLSEAAGGTEIPKQQERRLAPADRRDRGADSPFRPTLRTLC
ncbi:MAG: hypothetical protein NT018_10035 [Armatimonadetes bacterium]|nr:hypothetical protein [Armatimonadota bacterium]